MTEHYRFGGGASETTVSPLVLAALLVGIVLIVFLPRKKIIVPFLLIGILCPPGQTVVIGGIHLFVVRILILFGCLRMMTIRLTGAKVLVGGLVGIDKAFSGWAVSHAVAFMLLYRQGDAIVNQFGFLWDCMGGYFLIRFAISDEDDVRLATRIFALISIISAAGMLYEQLFAKNLFGFLGAQLAPEVRDGKIRSQGPFAHAILAGVFGATIFPLFVRLFSTGKSRLLAISGAIGSVGMVLTSASSTPIGAFGAGVIGLFFWPLRKHMRAIRWGIVLALVALALVMKAPVWYVIAHIDFTGSSSSYHRAFLIDQCVRHFQEWWLVGANNNQNWGFDLWDIQNEFVAEALRGGLAALTFFIILISRSFGQIGRARDYAEANRSQAWLIWTMGAVIFAHVVAFFGADYFDQTRFWWWACLAMTCIIRGKVPGEDSASEAQGDAEIEKIEEGWYVESRV